MSLYHFPLQRQHFQNGIFYDSVFMPSYADDNETRNAEVVLLTLTTEQNKPLAEQWRQYLSALTGVPFETMKIADLGYYVSEENTEDDVVKSFMENLYQYVQGRLLILTDRPEWISYMARISEKECRMAIFTSYIKYHGPKNTEHSPDLYALVEEKKLVSLSLIGVQNYYLSYEDMRLLQHHKKIDYLRLSGIQDDINEVEPYVRHAGSVLILHNSMQTNDSPGISPDDMQKAVYLTALSPFNKQLWIDLNTPFLNQLSLIAWHYLWGTYNKMEDFPFIERKKLKEIIVKKNNLKKRYFFNPISGRFWIEELKKNRSIDGLLPCTEKNYLTFKQNGEALSDDTHLF